MANLWRTVFFALGLVAAGTRNERVETLQKMMDSLKTQVQSKTAITPEVQTNIDAMIALIPDILGAIETQNIAAQTEISSLYGLLEASHNEAVSHHTDAVTHDETLWTCYSTTPTGEEPLYQAYLACREEEWYAWEFENITCAFDEIHEWHLGNEHFGKQSCKYNYQLADSGMDMHYSLISPTAANTVREHLGSEDQFTEYCDKLRSFHVAFWDGIYDGLVAAQEVVQQHHLACDAAKAAHLAKQQECSDKLDDWLMKIPTCEGHLGSKTTSACSYTTHHISKCTNYDLWKSFRALTETLVGDQWSEVDRQNEYEAVKTIECWLVSYGSTNAADGGPGFDEDQKTQCIADIEYPHQFNDHQDEVTALMTGANEVFKCIDNGDAASTTPSTYTLKSGAQYLPVTHSLTAAHPKWLQGSAAVLADYNEVTSHAYTLEACSG